MIYLCEFRENQYSSLFPNAMEPTLCGVILLAKFLVDASLSFFDDFFLEIS